MRLGFQIMGAKVRSKSVFLGSLSGAFCNLFLKPFVPGMFTVFILVIPLAIMLKVYAKSKYIIAFWVSVLVLLIIMIGSILIISPLCSLKPSIGPFLSQNPFGQCIGSLMESAFAMITLLLLSIFNVSLIPAMENLYATVNFVDIYLFGALFYWFYNASMRLFISEINNPKQIPFKLIAEWLVSTGAVIGLCIRQINVKNIKRNSICQQEKIQKLIDNNRELSVTNQELNEKVLKAQNNKYDNIDSNIQSTENLPIIKKKSYKIPDPKGNPAKITIGSSEMSVLLLIGFGKSNKEVTDLTGLADGTVRNIVTKLLSKLKCMDRTQLAIYVTNNKIINIVNEDSDISNRFF